ncbi:hypothetical protein GCM10010869_62380 [Mesorhizobium tianshanense]|uniref:Uncharacterized protein n=1 Tax=Mesorhizobium tianshanense TaxID=39844 RepID=A0A562MKG2_9HYPH|nr:hypothetical protein [Mesorhizobium tianshanense]TWI20383.1 hypothetical protein IQ26_06990 [Mesorhizobium tianshanense]GLS40641.1 hypothetical protein GCM10010869_62380 [Mesorhizobium tianshanense]
MKALVEAEVLAWDGGKFLRLGAKAHCAKEPTVKEVQEWIFDYIREKNPGARSGEIAANVTDLQIQLGLKHGVRVTEYGGATNRLIQEGYLTFDGGNFLKLTDNGFERLSRFMISESSASVAFPGFGRHRAGTPAQPAKTRSRKFLISTDPGQSVASSRVQRRKSRHGP